MKEYDEDEAVRYMREHVPAEVQQRYSDDDLLYFIDTLWDCYDKLGMTEIEESGEDDGAEQKKVYDLMCRLLLKDKYCEFAAEDIELLLQAEYAYEESLI